ncbi:hypothetical protein CLOM_g21184 [Closterium sp. NIES-68]|nr:hypothetical protein CLOM_g21184 [Closterium sp. NIES-68]
MAARCPRRGMRRATRALLPSLPSLRPLMQPLLHVALLALTLFPRAAPRTHFDSSVPRVLASAQSPPRATACAHVRCPPGASCLQGLNDKPTCVCEGALVAKSGRCVDLCGAFSCPVNRVCEVRRRRPHCACNPPFILDGRQCRDPCTVTSCPPNTHCSLQSPQPNASVACIPSKPNQPSQTSSPKRSPITTPHPPSHPPSSSSSSPFSSPSPSPSPSPPVLPHSPRPPPISSPPPNPLRPPSSPSPSDHQRVVKGEGGKRGAGGTGGGSAGRLEYDDGYGDDNGGWEASPINDENWDKGGSGKAPVCTRAVPGEGQVPRAGQHGQVRVRAAVPPGEQHLPAPLRSDQMSGL